MTTTAAGCDVTTMRLARGDAFFSTRRRDSNISSCCGQIMNSGGRGRGRRRWGIGNHWLTVRKDTRRQCMLVALHRKIRQDTSFGTAYCPSRTRLGNHQFPLLLFVVGFGMFRRPFGGGGHWRRRNTHFSFQGFQRIGRLMFNLMFHVHIASVFCIIRDVEQLTSTVVGRHS